MSVHLWPANLLATLFRLTVPKSIHPDLVAHGLLHFAEVYSETGQIMCATDLCLDPGGMMPVRRISGYEVYEFLDEVNCILGIRRIERVR